MCLTSAHDLLDFIRRTVAAAMSAPANSSESTSPSSPPVFRISFSPHATPSSGSFPTVTIRQLTAELVESEVVGGKKAVAGGRIGFLPRTWAEARRAHRVAAAERG